MSKFSKIAKGSGAKIPVGYNNIKISPNTQAKRDQLKAALDEFTGFKWCGINAFDVFGAFIPNKQSLKFYNGATYSNQYTTPQFESAAGQLTGVKFSIQKIDFTIGVYWINENDYRQLINWFNPYEINTLMFDFEPDYYYQVKLASVENSIRYIVGKETKIDDEGNIIRDRAGNIVFESQYYAEMKLTFEVQGTSCVYRSTPYEPIFSGQYNANEYVLSCSIDTSHGFGLPGNAAASDLATPFQLTCDMNLHELQAISSTQGIKLNINSYIIYDGQSQQELFSLVLKDLSFLEDDTQAWHFKLQYDSENGLLTLKHGNSDYFLLNNLTTVSTGKRIVDSIWAQKYYMPGIFIDPYFDITKWEIETVITAVKEDGQFISMTNNFVSTDLSSLNMRGRSNLI